ncbi:MAG TPA: UDP-N-acetylmuramoyl-L-alanine--D-glutamate ligase [Terriglobia bacterium]|nr:UDP-N-acetylmuramoyl-L-alanine--D-glutamate ligase [Terriglobia bacterium]
MMEVQGKRALVVGLARSGRAAARILNRKGAVVTVTDIRPPSTFPEEIPELTRLKIGLELGLHRDQTFLRQDLIVVSPGVPWDMPQLESARQHQIPVVPEIEVASWFLQGSIVGVTGSNGKTTTTTLLGKMLESSGLPTFVGGNIGVPLISAVEQARGDSLLVAELSSFQLEAIRSFRPHVAVLLNLSQNHLDRHHTFEAYVGAKARIFHNQTAEDYAILNADDPNVMNLAPAIPSQKIFFSRTRNLPDGVFVSNGHIVYRVGDLERILLEASDVRLRGDFNVDDVLAASAAACVVGAEFGAIRESVREFKGVEHRLEFLCQIHRVDFYNDSKATSVDATAKALTAFNKGVHLIMGGKDKGAPYTPLRPLLKDRVTEVLLIGSAADKIARDLEGAVEIVRAGDLATAVRRAFNVSLPGDTVLLAPACASYDQFKDFEERGRVFKDLVADLAREATVSDFTHPAQSAGPAAPLSAPVIPTPESQARGASVAQNADAGVEGRLPASADPPAPEPRAPAPKPDLVYLYEVDAAEFAPAPEEPPLDSLGEEPAATEASSLGNPEAAGDEVLPYEVSPAIDERAGEIAEQPNQKSESGAEKKEQTSLFGDAGDSGQKPEA